MKVTDGNLACATMAYNFSEISFIYPITPSSPMASQIDLLSNKGVKNVFDDEVKIIENSLIKDDILIMWSENLYYKDYNAHINEIKKTTFPIKKEIILVGISDNYERNKEILERVFKINIFEYENSDTILFERA